MVCFSGRGHPRVRITWFRCLILCRFLKEHCNDHDCETHRRLLNPTGNRRPATHQHPQSLTQAKDRRRQKRIKPDAYDKRAMACGERCLRQPSRRYGFHSHGFTNWWQPDKERLRCRLMRRFGKWYSIIRSLDAFACHRTSFGARVWSQLSPCNRRIRHEHNPRTARRVKLGRARRQL